MIVNDRLIVYIDEKGSEPGEDYWYISGHNLVYGYQIRVYDPRLFYNFHDLVRFEYIGDTLLMDSNNGNAEFIPERKVRFYGCLLSRRPDYPDESLNGLKRTEDWHLSCMDHLCREPENLT